MIIVEAAFAIAPRRSLRGPEVAILVARTPFWFVTRSPLARSFATITIRFMLLIRLIASRGRLRPRFIALAVVKSMPSLAMTRPRLALAIPVAPLRVLRLAVAIARQPIAIVLEHAVIVVLRTLAGRFIRRMLAPASKRVLLAPCFAIANVIAPSHRTISGPLFGAG
jgi:hypothetical protein